MKMSDSITALATALASAQAAMGAAHKDSINPAFSSKYADLSSVVDAIKPHLTANGIAYLQFVKTTERDEVGVETILMHSSGEYIAGDPFYLPVAKANAHGFGSALTYARRYSLSAACGLKADDDDGNAASVGPVEGRIMASAAVKPITATQEAKDTFDRMPADEQQFLRDEAMKLIALHESDQGDVIGHLDGLRLDTEEKLALWSLLPSNVRSAIKKSKQEMKAA